METVLAMFFGLLLMVICGGFTTVAYYLFKLAIKELKEAIKE